MKRNKKWSIKNILFTILVISSLILVRFGLFNNKEPKELYMVYLAGEKIGVVKDKNEFNSYINTQEEKLKTLYEVDTIYAPKGVEIKKVLTYDNKVDSNEKIYNLLVSSENFTIKGYVFDIKKEVEEIKKDENGKEVSHTKEEITSINVLNKEIFDKSIIRIVKAFVDEEDYNNFMNSTQKDIEEYGEIIEDIYIDEEIVYREDYIPTNEHIFKSEDELTKYLLYGTVKEQNTYVVKDGDTIESVAKKNKLNVQEFLIANPEFTSENNLLYTSQVVKVGLINPVISVVVEKHSVKEETQSYSTDIKYDSNLVVGYSYVERKGEDGLDKVTRKYQYINGQLSDVALISSVEIKPSVSKILVKGERYIPYVADLSYWAWPTKKPYTITTGYQYRWGSFHAAIDIYVGFGSPIYAANNGTVYAVGSGCVRGNTKCNGGRGNYIIINHNIKNYYTQYMHLDSINVKPGQTVSRGQKIGTMGNSGFVVPTPPYGSKSLKGTHLDFGVWIGAPNQGYTINPWNLY
ncbi:MAG: peptidoglycan DD-metalloendopeptidase family protein [Bacilli bacterium]|nr:peptidoglycan DD-metalloendopeptidase family protein [Bacilli bacterium]